MFLLHCKLLPVGKGLAHSAPVFILPPKSHGRFPICMSVLGVVLIGSAFAVNAFLQVRSVFSQDDNAAMSNGVSCSWTILLPVQWWIRRVPIPAVAA